nr:hypothetical protein [Tanacetum cinerariifolium]
LLVLEKFTLCLGPAVLTGLAALVDVAAFGLASLTGILPDLVNTTVGANLLMIYSLNIVPNWSTFRVTISLSHIGR